MHLALARCWDWPPCGRLVRVLSLDTAGGGHVRFRVLTHYREKIVCQKNGQSLAEADECGKSLTHFKVCQSVSEVPPPAVYGPSSAFSFLVARSTFQSESGT